MQNIVCESCCFTVLYVIYLSLLRHSFIVIVRKHFHSAETVCESVNELYKEIVFSLAPDLLSLYVKSHQKCGEWKNKKRISKTKCYLRAKALNQNI